MKICPACQTQYTDETLNFCLQDGTPLVARSAPTVAFNEQETVVATRPTNPASVGYGIPPPADSPAPGSRRGFLMAVLFFAALGLVVFGGVGIWLVLSGRTPYSRPNPLVANSGSDGPISNSSPKTPVAASNRPAKNANAEQPVVDAVRIRSEVTDRIEEWRSGIESVDLDRLMGNYADSVDYYNRRGVSRSVVREDKQRAFVKFDSMRMTVSGLKITVGPNGGTATAVFDKEWVFTSSAGDRTAGKVSQQLNLAKTGGKWLITGEKDLRVIR